MRLASTTAAFSHAPSEIREPLHVGGTLGQYGELVGPAAVLGRVSGMIDCGDHEAGIGQRSRRIGVRQERATSPMRDDDQRQSITIDRTPHDARQGGPLARHDLGDARCPHHARECGPASVGGHIDEADPGCLHRSRDETTDRGCNRLAKPSPKHPFNSPRSRSVCVSRWIISTRTVLRALPALVQPRLPASSLWPPPSNSGPSSALLNQGHREHDSYREQ